MNFKRFFSLILVLALCLTLVAAVTGCDSGASKKKLYIFNCGDYIAPEITKLFEKEFPQYKVVYDTYDTNETMYQKLVSTNIPYDIIVPSDYMVERLIKENRLMKLDYSKIPNAKNIDEKMRAFTNVFDPGAKYSLPYRCSMMSSMFFLFCCRVSVARTLTGHTPARCGERRRRYPDGDRTARRAACRRARSSRTDRHARSENRKDG